MNSSVPPCLRSGKLLIFNSDNWRNRARPPASVFPSGPSMPSVSQQRGFWRARDGIADTSPWSAARTARWLSSAPPAHGTSGRPRPTVHADAGRGNTRLTAGARGIVAIETGNLIVARMDLVRKSDGLRGRIILVNADA